MRLTARHGTIYQGGRYHVTWYEDGRCSTERARILVSADVAHALRERVREVAAERPYHRLVLLVGDLRSGKTTVLRAAAGEGGWARLGLGAALSERLLQVATRQRPAVVQSIAEDLSREVQGEVLALDNIELLFHPDLAVDPLRLLLALSRHRVVVASWPGTFDGTTLTYAEPGHPEHRREPRPGCAVVTVPSRPSSAPAPVARDAA